MRTLQFPRWTAAGQVSVVDPSRDSLVLVKNSPARGRLRLPVGVTMLLVTEGIDCGKATARLGDQDLDLLRVLHLHDPACTFLQHLSGISTLGLAANATDECIDAVARLTELRRLGLVGPSMTDKTLRSLSEISNLEYVSLSSPNFSTSALVHLMQNSSNLSTLVLDHCDIGDDLLVALAEVPLALEKLVFNQGHLPSQSAIAALKQAHAGLSFEAACATVTPSVADVTMRNQP